MNNGSMNNDSILAVAAGIEPAERWFWRPAEVPTLRATIHPFRLAPLSDQAIGTANAPQRRTALSNRPTARFLSSPLVPAGGVGPPSPSRQDGALPLSQTGNWSGRSGWIRTSGLLLPTQAR